MISSKSFAPPLSTSTKTTISATVPDVAEIKRRLIAGIAEVEGQLERTAESLNRAETTFDRAAPDPPIQREWAPEEQP